MLDHGIVDDAHQLIHPLAEITGADEPVLALLELGLSLLVTFVEQPPQLGHEPGAQLRRIADRLAAEGFQDALGCVKGHGATAYGDVSDLTPERPPPKGGLELSDRT